MGSRRSREASPIACLKAEPSQLPPQGLRPRSEQQEQFPHRHAASGRLSSGPTPSPKPVPPPTNSASGSSSSREVEAEVSRETRTHPNAADGVPAAWTTGSGRAKGRRGWRGRTAEVSPLGTEIDAFAEGRGSVPLRRVGDA